MDAGVRTTQQDMVRTAECAVVKLNGIQATGDFKRKMKEA
jgi:hypothetical protein